MTLITAEPTSQVRHYCRNLHCRSKLSAPVENRAQAFFVEVGRRESESRHDVATSFRNVDSAAWHDMACWSFERRHRLAHQHQDFLEGMIEVTREHELSTKQQAYLRSLYRKLGGKM
jgi:hypothetical protein